MNKIKKNVLKPILFVCLGLVFSTVVVAQRLLFPPDAPGMPMITNLWSTGCTIEFTAPKDDGGSPVDAYIIEYRKKDRPYWQVQGSTRWLTYSANNKTPGDEEEFRVRAQNAEGLGDPSDPSFMVTYKNR